MRDFLNRLDPAAAPFLVGAVVSLAIVTAFAVLRRLSHRSTRPPRYVPLLGAERPAAADPTPSGIWLRRDTNYSDRRGAVRRKGAAVRVVVSSPAVPGGVAWGVVLDRSTSGLRLAVDQAMAAGTPLQVRAANAPDTSPWVAITVRSCSVARGRHELGCEFDLTPPWNVLLLFG